MTRSPGEPWWWKPRAAWTVFVRWPLALRRQGMSWEQVGDHMANHPQHPDRLAAQTGGVMYREHVARMIAAIHLDIAKGKR